MTLKVVRGGYNNAQAAIDSFAFIPIVGKCDPDERNPGYLKQVYWEEINGNYQLQFKMIARKKGIYSVAIVDGLARNKKNTATISVRNANLNNNLYYLNTYYSGPVPPTDSILIYNFKVK